MEFIDYSDEVIRLVRVELPNLINRIMKLAGPDKRSEVYVKLIAQEIEKISKIEVDSNLETFKKLNI